MFNELVDLEEGRLAAIDFLMTQNEIVAKAYNKKVKYKTFNLGDLVWKVILSMDRKDRTLGKWSQNWEWSFKVLQAYTNNVYGVEKLTPEGGTLRINGKYLKQYRPIL